MLRYSVGVGVGVMRISGRRFVALIARRVSKRPYEFLDPPTDFYHTILTMPWLIHLRAYAMPSVPVPLIILLTDMVSRCRLLAAHGARSCLLVRTQPLMATAPSQTSTIPYHTIPYRTMCVLPSMQPVKASAPGRHQEQASKQRCTFRPTTFSSVQFSGYVYLIGYYFLSSIIIFKVQWLRLVLALFCLGMVWYLMVEVCEGAPLPYHTIPVAQWPYGMV